LKSLYMETTTISMDRTAQEIVLVLVQAGATNVNQQYENRKLIGLRWTMNMRGREVPFEMPARVNPVYAMLKKRSGARQKDILIREQAERVAWRQLLRWVQAQTAMIETGMVEPAEVFASYISTPTGTLYQCLSEGKIRGYLPAPLEAS